MKEKKKSDLAVLLDYVGSYKGLTFVGLGLSAVAMILGMMPYICIWLVIRDLIAVAPDWTKATSISHYGWRLGLPWQGSLSILRLLCVRIWQHFAVHQISGKRGWSI